MKTSLNIDEVLFREAKNEAASSGNTISDIINHWALVGKKILKEEKDKKRVFEPASLGEQKIDLSNRKEWMDELK